MPWSALPPHIDEPREWTGTDFDKPGLRWHNRNKGWFAYGPLAKEWWARWRALPLLVFAAKGDGPWRWENDGDGPYLSRIQYWTRWHFAVQWPLQITFHIYWRKRDVPTFPNNEGEVSIKHMLYLYGPTHRDSDKVYWFPSFFLGGTFK